MLDVIEVEVIRNALAAAAAEMDVTIWRTSRSTIVRELLDYSTAVFDADGYNVAQSARIPQHLNSMGAALRTLLDEHVNAKNWGPGDVVVTNDPYCGAQHLNDLLVFKPVFHDGQRIAYVGALCHHIDVGGMAPGSYAATATEVFQEGLRLPPVQLIESGNLNHAVWAIIGQNVRKPALMLGDLQSQLASLNVGSAAIVRLAERYSSEGLKAAMTQILDMSEAAMRAAIRAMPDGVYEFEDFIDNDGLSESPVRLAACRRKGSRAFSSAITSTMSCNHAIVLSPWRAGRLCSTNRSPRPLWRRSRMSCSGGAFDMIAGQNIAIDRGW